MGKKSQKCSKFQASRSNVHYVHYGGETDPLQFSIITDDKILNMQLKLWR